ncbi:tRNA-dihydrouridine synthase family protein [Deinococcus radiodurans R1 = ATCC 13939 = DSM 20539]|uniref:NifR3 protein n=2 Tax=Deinococcus radiodurans TaxID=1299 RepID=Q9RRP8_DEIRA|nr:nifR3 protein [Deinococcus radiodurans R1 = ATCC 13939 = DSM 20539]QEM71812.1 tRNA-dihydrouridine synthase family protein [Deinococcus radiodurans]UDL01453.1 tRNA-dihydrouridine synthase family protein [Deinococcus radiodurans R1 = ATCC 13939 = DSM 20539]HCE65284.1 tRNA-dihydrouridine synthase family protein [Deinococcus radiodurans]
MGQTGSLGKKPGSSPRGTARESSQITNSALNNPKIAHRPRPCDRLVSRAVSGSLHPARSAQALFLTVMTAYAASSSAAPATGGFYAERLSRPGAVLAPMAGYSDAPMRQLAAEQGALWTVSEMISARGLVLGSEQESLSLGRPYPGEQGRAVQLFGADPDVLADAVGKAEAWFAPAAIDLNLGCPVPKVRGKGGACLLQTPEVAYELVRAMRQATGLDVSAKIRLGWDENRSVEIAQGLEAAGAAVVTVHGRTSAQRYTGNADWDAIGRVAQAVRIPVIGSGDVLSPVQARERMQQSGVAAVMIGRGAVGNPWMFRAIASGEETLPPAQERARTALRHAELQHDFYTTPHRRDPSRLHVASMRPLRKVLPKYLPDQPDLHPALHQVETLDDVRAALVPLLAESLRS